MGLVDLDLVEIFQRFAILNKGLAALFNPGYYLLIIFTFRSIASDGELANAAVYPAG